MEITVYADVLLAVNFLIDYLLLLFCARLSGRRMIRKRLLAGALVGALTSLVIFLPPLSFWPMTLLKAGIAALMVRLAYPKEDGRKIKLLLDLTEEMLHTLKTRYPQKVFFA